MTWLSGIWSSLGGFMLSPLFAVLGVLAISSPIIIHLLNKRRFKIVDWAAMDFLFDADKRNRRRLRLENLILLLLRCLAMILIGLLLARLFIPTGMAASLIESPQFERIVVLDDSLSMQVRVGNESAMDVAKQSLIDITRDLADSQSNDMLTLILTSKPDGREISSERVTAKSVEDLVGRIKNIEASDKTANLDVVLQELERDIAAEKKNINRVIYVLTDFRKRDWEADAEDSAENAPPKTLERLAKLVSGCIVVDVGSEERSNLAVTDVQPEDRLIAGVSSRFDVKVTNRGEEDVRDVRVRLSVADSLPQEETIPLISAGKTETASFNFAFTLPEAPLDAVAPDATDAGEDRDWSFVRLEAGVIAANEAEQDRLEADSVRYFAARVLRGVPVLIVDGDPSADDYRSESFYLERALSPPGPVSSGIVADVVTDTELDSVSLNKYQVVFLCNVYRLSEERIIALEKWVEAGGGLVIMPGDQVDDGAFNKEMYKEGKGLSPVQLTAPQGDETEEEWMKLQVNDENHPVLSFFAGQDNPLLSDVKVFRWWGSSIAKEQRDVVSMPAQFTDIDQSPAVVEKAFGKGRVLVMTTPADRDWANWCDLPSYIVANQLLVRYMARNVAGSGDVRVGESIKQLVDLTAYRMDASLRAPDDERMNVQAVPIDDGKNGERNPAEEKNVVWQIDVPEADRRGFYELQLTRTDGGNDNVLFAANVDPTEGQLDRVNLVALRRDLRGENIRIVDAGNAAGQGVQGSQFEFWGWILGMLVGVLCLEQFLGWLFGLSRR